jgi:hypothetical protein
MKWLDTTKMWLGKFSAAKIRTGTKISICWLVFSALLILWLLVGIPLLSIFYPHITQFAPHLSAIIAALIGGSAATFTTTEVRKTVENIKSVKRDDKIVNPYGE